MDIQSKNMNNKQHIVRNMLISAALLGVFGLLGTSLVLAINMITKDRIEENIKASLLQSLNSIIPADAYNNNLITTSIEVPAHTLLGKKTTTTVYQAWKDNQPVAIAFDIIAADGYSGKIKILLAIQKNGNLSAVRIITHKETPGLGDKIEIERSDWITSFNNKSLVNTKEKQWRVKKDGGIFDQFTGATITPRAIVKAVHHALLYYQAQQKLLYLNQQEYNRFNLNSNNHKKNEDKQASL
jgi:Na+-translocating ferredoxin:NAD+ oxidoreductase subunit G